MSFGSILSGVYHAITPWHDSGSVFSGSSYQPKKKKPEDFSPPAPIITRVQPSQPQNQGQGLRAQQPKNVFEGLNNNLVFNKPNTTLPVVPTKFAQPPQPGTVVQPTNKTPEDKVNDGLNAGHSWEQISKDSGVDLNSVKAHSQKTRPNYGITPASPAAYKPPGFWRTLRDTAIGTVANVPEVALGGARAATGLVQGAAQIPHAVSSAVATGTQQLQRHMNNPITRQINRGFQDVNTGVIKGTHYVVNDALDPLNRRLDQAAGAYERHVPGATGGAKVYRVEQPLLNALAAVATAGGSAVAEGAGDAGAASDVGRLGRLKTIISDFLNKPRIANEDNLISRTAQPIIDRVRPVAEDLNAPVKAVRNLINRIGGNAAVDTGEIGNVLTPNEVNDLTTRNVPVRTGVDINAPPSESVNIPVRNGNRPARLIQEVGGDAKTATTSADAAARVVNVRRVEAAKRADTGLPDRAIEGVTSRPVERPYSLDQPTVAKNQADVVDQYAEQLRSMGEGNGVNTVPDGQGGYKRVSENVRDPSLKGQRMTQADWRDEAARQLESGKADSAVQQAFDDAKSPEVQSMINNGERPNVEPGRPITVTKATGIPVEDQTNIPQGLPETPGQVRITTSTAPANARAEAIAAETPAVTTPGAPVDNAALPRNPDGTTKLPGDSTPPPAPDSLPNPGETDESFLRRIADDTQTNIKRAVDALKVTKKMTKAERSRRAAEGQTAYEEAKAAGKSISEQEQARKAAYSGQFDRQDYSGSPIHSADEQRLRDMVDQHYSDMPYQAGNVREAFDKLFHSGEPGYHSADGNHIIPSDIKNIRKFLNESVPNPDGHGGLGDFTEEAIKELANTEDGPGKVAKAIGLQRALRFTADISATGRQALPGALSHPIEFAKAVKQSFGVMFSGKKYDELVSKLSNSKEANYINDRLGAYISVLGHDGNKADDIYRNSEWADKIPGVKQVVNASERQYNTLLSMMRLQSGQRYIDAAGGIANLEKAASDSGDAESFLKAIGTVSNVNTGRGQIGKLGSSDAKILSNVLVSPKGLAARIQRFNPKYYTDLYKANPAAGKEALRSLGIQTAVTVGSLAAAQHAGLYEDGQIKVGNTRYDITGGAANMVRTAVRVAQYMTGHRATTPLDNAPDEVVNWARNQLAPFLSSSLSVIGIHPDGKGGFIDHWGKPVSVESLTLDNLAPVNASQVNSDLQSGTSPGQTAINAGLNTLGFGVNTYQSSGDKAKADKASSAMPTNPTLAEYKAGVKPSDNGLVQLDDGSFAYTINGDTKSAPTLEKAQEAIAKDSVQNSDASYKIIGDKVYRKNADGTVGKPMSKTSFDYGLDKAVLSSQKQNGDLNGWMKTANKQINRIQEQLKDPNIDPYDAQKLTNEEQTLVDDMAKYKTYGGFKKGSGSGGGRRAIDTSFGQLKAGDFAPKVRQYDTIDTKSGAVPHISVVRPNIVHKITSG